MVNGRSRSVLVLVGLAWGATPACGPDRGDEDGDEVGEVDDDDDDDGELDELDAQCELTCAYLFECAPGEFGQIYANLIECRTTCVARYSTCVPEARNYLACFMDLSCTDVILSSAEGPGVTACGPAFAAAEAACGL